MKGIVKIFILFGLLSLALSGFSCSGQKAVVDEPAAPSSGPETKNPSDKKTSEYPPISTAVAQADLKNLDGTTFKVADRKGKVLLLNMWATWCGPCRAEMPTLVQLQDKFRDRDFEVIGLNTDDEKVEDIRKFADDMSLNYTLVWADSNLQKELLNISRFGGIPQSFLIDRDGRLRGVFKGANPQDIKKMAQLVENVVNE